MQTKAFRVEGLRFRAYTMCQPVQACQALLARDADERVDGAGVQWRHALPDAPQGRQAHVLRLEPRFDDPQGVSHAHRRQARPRRRQHVHDRRPHPRRACMKPPITNALLPITGALLPQSMVSRSMVGSMVSQWELDQHWDCVAYQ